MKTKLVLPFILILFLWGCKEEKKIEIISDYDKIYLPPDKLSEVPQLTEGNDQKLLDSILNLYHKLYLLSDSSKNKPTMEYKFMINETGSIDKIFLGNNNDEKINQLVLNTIKSWKYKPGVKDGKAVKSQMPMILWFEMNKPINENEYSVMVESMPSVVGGMASILKKIVYPEAAKRNGFQGKVLVSAFVDENGNVNHTKIIKGIGGGCDEAAMNAINQIKFIPGKHEGKPVKVQVTIPIVFKLQ